MKINTYRITTCMGKVFDNNELPFLTTEEFQQFNQIGYSGKDLAGNKMTRTDYLNSLNKGTFSVELTKWDNGDFSEDFTIIKVDLSIDE